MTQQYIRLPESTAPARLRPVYGTGIVAGVIYLIAPRDDGRLDAIDLAACAAVSVAVGYCEVCAGPRLESELALDDDGNWCCLTCLPATAAPTHDPEQCDHHFVRGTIGWTCSRCAITIPPCAPAAGGSAAPAPSYSAADLDAHRRIVGEDTWHRDAYPFCPLCKALDRQAVKHAE